MVYLNVFGRVHVGRPTYVLPDVCCVFKFRQDQAQEGRWKSGREQCCCCCFYTPIKRRRNKSGSSKCGCQHGEVGRGRQACSWAAERRQAFLRPSARALPAGELPGLRREHEERERVETGDRRKKKKPKLNNSMPTQPSRK